MVWYKVTALASDGQKPVAVSKPTVDFRLVSFLLVMLRVEAPCEDSGSKIIRHVV